jgi:hypothetical protein
MKRQQTIILSIMFFCSLFLLSCGNMTGVTIRADIVRVQVLEEKQDEQNAFQNSRNATVTLSRPYYENEFVEVTDELGLVYFWDVPHGEDYILRISKLGFTTRVMNNVHISEDKMQKISDIFLRRE